MKSLLRFDDKRNSNQEAKIFGPSAGRPQLRSVDIDHNIKRRYEMQFNTPQGELQNNIEKVDLLPNLINRASRDSNINNMRHSVNQPLRQQLDLQIYKEQNQPSVPVDFQPMNF